MYIGSFGKSCVVHEEPKNLKENADIKRKKKNLSAFLKLSYTIDGQNPLKTKHHQNYLYSFV